MNTVQSIERAFLLLEAVATADLGLTEIANEVGLPKSTVARLIHTLETVGAIERIDAEQRYRIGKTVRGLAGGGGRIADLVPQARPHLRMLARDTGEDAGLSVPDGLRVHYIAQEEAVNAILVKDWTGSTIPMHVVPSGLVVLAHWPTARVDRFLQQQLEAFSPNSITDPDEIRARLDQIRSDGHAWVYGEFDADLNSVAAPLLGDDGVVGAVHVHGPAYRFPEPGTSREIAARVMETASRLSEAHQLPG